MWVLILKLVIRKAASTELAYSRKLGRDCVAHISFHGIWWFEGRGNGKSSSDSIYGEVVSRNVVAPRKRENSLAAALEYVRQSPNQTGCGLGREKNIIRLNLRFHKGVQQ